MVRQPYGGCLIGAGWATWRDPRRRQGFARVVLLTLLQIIDLLVSVVVFLIIVQFVLSLLIAFNVVNTSNQFVRAVYTVVTALLDPILKPIRRFMPNTGAIDFSPLVLILLLNVLQIVLRNLVVAGY